MSLRRTRCLLALAIATTAQATIVYTPTEQSGGATANLSVMFQNVDSGIQGTVSVQPNGDPDIGDIRAVYFNLLNLPLGLTAEQVAAAITGSHVTATAVDTQGVSFGGGASINPLGPFTIGVEIGTAGIGKDDIQSTTFLINNALIDPDLSLSNFGAVGVRVQSIGLAGGGREGSGKFLDTTPMPLGDDPSEVPEPSTVLIFSSGLAFVAARRWMGSH